MEVSVQAAAAALLVSMAASGSRISKATRMGEVAAEVMLEAL